MGSLVEQCATDALPHTPYQVGDTAKIAVDRGATVLCICIP